MARIALVGLRGGLYALGAVALALVTGCAGPTYPSCAQDDQCRPHGEFCVDGKCAQCRVDANCPGAGSDACVTCEKGACGRKANCCTTNLDCGAGQKCTANACVAQCKVDADCASGSVCSPSGACVAAAVAGQVSDGCTRDSDCGGDLKCQQGLCVNGAGKCQVVPVPFDLDHHNLSPVAQNVLVADYKCMKQSKVRKLTVTGNCDERGTDAYNMELGAARAAAVKKFLQELDPKFRLKTISYGKARPVCNDSDEACYSKNRRADFQSGQ